MAWQFLEHQLHKAYDSDCFSYVAECEVLDYKSKVFGDVLHSVRAHASCFNFITYGFVAAKHGLKAARA